MCSNNRKYMQLKLHSTKNDCYYLWNKKYFSRNSCKYENRNHYNGTTYGNAVMQKECTANNRTKI